jgi:hypothetical protein
MAGRGTSCSLSNQSGFRAANRPCREGANRHLRHFAPDHYCPDVDLRTGARRKESGEDKNIQVMLQYCNAQGGTGVVNLTYWTPMSSMLPLDQKASVATIDQQLHDMTCRGIP